MAEYAPAGASELRRSGRVFAFTLAGGFAFVALVGAWRGVALLTDGAVVLAALSLLAGLLIPGRLDPVRRAWMAFGEALGRVTTPVMMAIVYYLVLTPTGLIRQLFVRKPDKSLSYWHARPPLPPKSRLERQF
ncbi:MAG: SxtJ family membrane protein [Gemmatimonadaceae bacterium]